MLRGRFGPLILAMLLGLVSVPFVAAAFVYLPADTSQQFGTPQMDWLDAVRLALASALSASLVGGLAGGALIRKRYLGGAFVAVATAWPVGIGVLPIAGNMLGITVRMGVVCLDACNPSITGQDPFSGFAAYGISLGGGFALIVPIGILLVFAVLAQRVYRGRFAPLGVFFLLIGYAALHLFSVGGGGEVAYLCLAIGVFCWALVLRPRPADSVDQPVEMPTLGSPANT